MQPHDPIQPPPLQCSLHEWQAMRLGLLFAYDQTVPRGGADGTFERHGEYSAWLIKEGHIQLESDGEHVSAHAGDWVFCFGTHITQQLSPDTRLISVRMVHAWPDQAVVFGSTRTVLVLEAARYPQLEGLALRLLSEPRLRQVEWLGRGNPAVLFGAETRLDLDGYLRHQRCLLDWTEGLAAVLREAGWGVRVPRGIDSKLADVLNLLDTQRPGDPFPGRRFTSITGLTLGQLNRMCVRHLGKTLYAYWEGRRLTQARFRLGQPSTRIKEIAAELGFKRLSHFSTWFKRQDGHSPRAFARAARSSQM